MNTTPYHHGVSDDRLKVLVDDLLTLFEDRKRSYSLKLILEAILHRTAQGCTWRAVELPGQLPWSVVYYYFRIWTHSGVIDRLNALLVRRERIRSAPKHRGAKAQTEPRTVVADAQTVKARVWGWMQQRGYDGHKHIKGIARHLVTDLRGNVLAVVASAANCHESQWLKEALIAVRYSGFEEADRVIADGGYRGQEEAAASQGFELKIVMRSDQTGPKGQQPNTFEPLKQRWVIERTIGYLMHNRILVCCYERLTETAEAVVYWASIRTLLRRKQKS